jgi:acyl-CoA thioesterase
MKPGYCRAALPLKPHMVNGLGMPHGAVLFALADFTFAGAGNSHGTAAVALSMDIHFLSSPRPDDRLECEAVEVRLGRKTALYRLTIFDSDQTAVAELHGMAYRKDTHFLPEEE